LGHGFVISITNSTGIKTKDIRDHLSFVEQAEQRERSRSDSGLYGTVDPEDLVGPFARPGKRGSGSDEDYEPVNPEDIDFSILNRPGLGPRLRWNPRTRSRSDSGDYEPVNRDDLKGLFARPGRRGSGSDEDYEPVDPNEVDSSILNKPASASRFNAPTFYNSFKTLHKKTIDSSTGRTVITLPDGNNNFIKELWDSFNNYITICRTGRGPISRDDAFEEVKTLCSKLEEANSDTEHLSVTKFVQHVVVNFDLLNAVEDRRKATREEQRTRKRR